MTAIIKFEDIGVVYKDSYKKGIYNVNNKNFYYKIDALKEADRSGAIINWDFHSGVFAEQARKPRLNISMPELYRLRAQQLRDKHNYLVLCYSGGADSDNILEVFLRNNIKLDEILVEQSLKLFESIGFHPSTNKDYSNWPSEWYLVVKPKLDQIAKLYPNIKITIIDNSLNPQEDDDEDTCRMGSVPTSYIAIRRHRLFDSVCESYQEKYKNAAVIVGCDKCVPSVKNGTFGFLITDFAAAFTTKDLVYFYWTPDMPEIVVEQAWCVWDYLHLYPKIAAEKFLSIRKNFIEYATNRDLHFDQIVKTITYPYWNINTFQANKALGQLHHNAHWLIQNYQNERWYQAWHSNFKSTLSSLSLDAFEKNNRKNDYVRFTNYHALGAFSSKGKNYD